MPASSAAGSVNAGTPAERANKSRKKEERERELRETERVVKRESCTAQSSFDSDQ